MKGQKDLRLAAQHVFKEAKRPPGDDPSRATYFDHVLIPARDARLVVDRSVKIGVYEDHKKRIPLTVPSKLRENMRALLGVDSDDEYAVTTTLVALADYACQVLSEQNKTLRVSPAGRGQRT